MKKLIVSICTLALTATLLGTSTFAWFSMNRSVDVKGMTVTATADSSLVITAKSSGIPTTTTYDTSISFAPAQGAAVTSLKPATHDGAYSRNLKTLTDESLQAVNSVSGLGTNLEYEDVTTANYVDYEAYICAQGTTMSGYNLEVRIGNLTGIGLTTLMAATSVDFYYGIVESGVVADEKYELTSDTTIKEGKTYYTKVSEAYTPVVIDGEVVKIGASIVANTYYERSIANFAGTLNLAHIDTTNNTLVNSTNASTSVTDYKLTIPVGKIPGTVKTDPSSSSEKLETIYLLMRVYIDGALNKVKEGGVDTTGAFVNSASVAQVAETVVDVHFDAVVSAS